MKVIHVETGMHLYGGALQVFYLLRGLREHDGEHVLVCPPGAAVGKAVAELGIRVIETPCKGDLDIGFIGRLRRIIRDEQADIVHLHSRRGADLLGGIAAWREGVQCILTRRVDNPEPKWWVRRKYRLYDRVVVISEGIREVLVSEGVPDNRIETIHSAVDTDRFKPEDSREWFYQTFHLPADARTVGMIAQFIPRKGHRILLQAASSVITALPKVHFLLFGKGPLEQDIAKEIEDLGLHSHVHLCGFRDDLHRVIPNLDVVAHPASMEGLGVSLLQASACGVPVVAAPAGGIGEVVNHGVSGILMDPVSPDTLASALVDLIRYDAKRRQMGLAARDEMLNHFSISSMVRRYRNIYEQLARNDVQHRES